MVPVGLAGRHQDALEGRLAMGRQQRLAGESVPGLGGGFDQNRLAAERGQDVTIRRIARHRDGHAIARLEHGQKREDEAG